MQNPNGHRPRYDGVSVYMDGQEWIVPALSLRQVRTHYQTLLDSVNITPENSAEKLPQLIRIVLDAMQRNYPELTEDRLLDMIDLRTLAQITSAIYNASGFRPAKPGEAQPAAASIGAGSTAP